MQQPNNIAREIMEHLQQRKNYPLVKLNVTSGR